MYIHSYKEANSPYWVAAFETPEQFANTEIFDFCYKNFGPGLGDMRVDNSPFVHRWVNDIKWGEVRFSQEADLQWFLMRWM